MCGVVLSDLCTTMSISTKKTKESQSIQNCDALPVNILRRVHGPAFDARYMSITEPTDEEDDSFDPWESLGRKRNADSGRPSFYMIGELAETLSDEPAWSVDWESVYSQTTSPKRSLPTDETTQNLYQKQSHTLSRKKRQNQVQKDPWKCESVVKWEFLGHDFYPPHLRTVECTKPKCYYKMYDCMPKQFAVRILQRRRGACADAASLKAYGFTGQYAEVWEWIEKPVTFCCDCVATNRYY